MSFSIPSSRGAELGEGAEGVHIERHKWRKRAVGPPKILMDGHRLLLEVCHLHLSESQMLPEVAVVVAIFIFAI